MRRTLQKDSKKPIPIAVGVHFDHISRRFRHLAGEFRRWVWSADAQGLYTFVSPSETEILGYSPQQLIGQMHFYDFCAPEGSANTRAKLLAYIAKRRSIRHFLRAVLHENGSVRWLSTNAAPKLAKDGRFLGYVGLEEDVTESVTAQLKLSESEARLSAILENTTDLIWSVDPEQFSLLFWNSAFTRFVQDEYSRKLHKGMFCEEILPPFLAERWNSLFRRARREGPFEGKYVIHSGKRVFNLTFNLVKNQGAVSALSVFARDITVADKAEKAVLKAHRTLAESEARLTALVESTSDFIWSVNVEQFGLLTYNTKFAEYCEQGLGVRAAIGMTPRNLTSTERAQVWETFYRRALHEGPFHAEIETIALNRILDLHFTVLKRGGQIFGIAVFGRDITVERRAQWELDEQRLEIARIQRASTIGQLAASLSHQLGQPLTAIMANARAAIRLMSTSPPPFQDVQEILEDIIKDNHRAAEVIGQLGTLLNRGKSEYIPLQLNDLVAKATELLRSDAAIRNIIIEQQLTHNLPCVRGDPVQLTQMLLNVMLNGLEAMQESSTDDKFLLVRTFLAVDGSIEGSITDSGPGLSADRLERIFEPFYTTKKDGLGLGLTVSRAILERHQGRLWAQNNPAGGVIFCFSLPAPVSLVSGVPAGSHAGFPQRV